MIDSSGSSLRQEHISNFKADLRRWQVLLSAQNGTLQKFQAALSDIWDIHLNDDAYKQSTDARSLLFFQEMALNLVNIADFSVGLDGSGGGKKRSLIAIQEQWKSR